MKRPGIDLKMAVTYLAIAVVVFVFLMALLCLVTPRDINAVVRMRSACKEAGGEFREYLGNRYECRVFKNDWR